MNSDYSWIFTLWKYCNCLCYFLTIYTFTLTLTRSSTFMKLCTFEHFYFMVCFSSHVKVSAQLISFSTFFFFLLSNFPSILLTHFLFFFLSSFYLIRILRYLSSSLLLLLDMIAPYPTYYSTSNTHRRSLFSITIPSSCPTKLSFRYVHVYVHTYL